MVGRKRPRGGRRASQAGTVAAKLDAGDSRAESAWVDAVEIRAAAARAAHAAAVVDTYSARTRAAQAQDALDIASARGGVRMQN